jgi:SNF2 family DNA or RNA helicase
LVVAPLALATQWAAEVRSKAPGLKVYIHHGSSRAKDSKCFEKYDVVVTTFQVVTSEHALDGPLFEPHWWRIIVDEAHTIKNRSAKSSIGATSLTSQRRWCLTGTPIQNNVDELYSLFRFIQLKPYDKYQIWSGQIAGPINAGRGKVAMQRLHAVLGAVMLRRTKEVLKTSGVVLPARRVHRVLVEFSTREREVYDHLHRRVGQRIEKMILEGGGSQYMSALLQLLRLRQICDDLRLVTGRLDEDDRSAVVDASSENVDDLADMLKSLDVNRDLEDVQVQDQVQEEPMDTPSAKIIKLVSLLKSELSRKTIVFSQFTSMLDIMEPHLHHEGIRFVRYDGSMTPAKRDESLNALRNNPDVEVLLCSLKCGALGLNLTCASRVILVDPWWNPMISEQAIDRVHRLGQTHDVDVYELIVNKTVEQKICSLCDSKRQLASGVIDGAQSSAVTNKLSKAELLDLFN